jgi:hypothetical protein
MSQYISKERVASPTEIEKKKARRKILEKERLTGKCAVRVVHTKTQEMFITFQLNIGCQEVILGTQTLMRRQR